MFIEATSQVNGKEYANRFLIHTGYGGTILYDDQFVADTRIGDHIEIIDEQALKDSYGNVIKTRKGMLDELVIGSTALRELPVGFFEGAIGRQKMSVMGGNILKRFNLIIDLDKSYIYLKINSLYNISF